MQIPRTFIPTIVIFPCLILGMLFFALWYRQRSMRGRNDPESLQREIESADSSQGDQVWFSRQVHRGKWHNWSLIVRNRRYELKQKKGADGMPRGPLYFEATTCSLPYERQLAENDRTYMPSYRGFYVCLIGWTRRPHEEICRAADKMVGTLGDDVYEGNVQDFLKGLADRILEHRKATDFSWFRENVTSHYQDVETKLMAGPQVRTGSVRPRSMLQLASVDAGVRAWARG